MQSTEAQRFRRDNTLPAYSAHHYDSRRATRYKGITKNEDSSEADSVYDQYKRVSNYNDRVRERYTNSCAEHEAMVLATPEAERDYYTGTSAGILPEGHLQLRDLADTVGEAEFRNGSARERALREHPFMYRTLESTIKHHQYVEDHYNESHRMYGERDKHAKYASAKPPRQARDLYGNEPTNGYTPDSRSYPPNFPNPGHYSQVGGAGLFRQMLRAALNGRL